MTRRLPAHHFDAPRLLRSRRKLEALFAKLGISDAVEFRGPVHGEEKLELLAGARLFVHTSRWEGLPPVVLGAMALGRPVLVTPGTGMADTVGSAEAGFVVEADPRAIAEGLAAALDRPTAELNAIGENARRLVGRRSLSVARRVPADGRRV